jgi:hypothetical protein
MGHEGQSANMRDAEMMARVMRPKILIYAAAHGYLKKRATCRSRITVYGALI